MRTTIQTSVFFTFIISAGLILDSCASTGDASGGKSVIVIAAFGSSYESGLQNLEDFDTAVQNTFPDTDVYWAFTANFIVNKLREEGKNTIFARQIPVRTLEEVYAYLKEKGQKSVLVQSLHLMVGQEYRQVINTPANGLNVKFVHPLLFYPENIQNSVNALSSDFGNSSDTVTIFCAHGNEKHLEYNAELVMIDTYLRENFDNACLAVMEGIPEFDAVLEEVEAKNFKKVQFITFMLTYGDHMSNDVMGDEEDSWKTQIGLDAECTNGLASHAGVQKVFIDNMKIVMDQF